MSHKKIVNLKVNGIHCNGCVLKITNAIDALDRENVTNINIETGNVKVTFHTDKTTLSDIKSKISEVGFQVESVELE